jgi:hypothetical protein
MIEVAELVYSLFMSKVDFTNEIRNRFFPLFAKENTEFPFAVYNIGEVNSTSKDARIFPVTISIVYPPENFTEAISFADVVKDIVEGVNSIQYLNTISDWDQENQIIIININFQIIK